MNMSTTALTQETTPNYRDVIAELREVHGFTVAQIADHLQCGERTVYRWVSDAAPLDPLPVYVRSLQTLLLTTRSK